MIPTYVSFLVQQRVPNGQLIVYPDSGHGFLYQYASLFAKHVLLFLEG
jgi:pimeloyl-ACP methyl ester carboxylesterase